MQDTPPVDRTGYPCYNLLSMKSLWRSVFGLLALFTFAAILAVLYEGQIIAQPTPPTPAKGATGATGATGSTGATGPVNTTPTWAFMNGSTAATMVDGQFLRISGANGPTATLVNTQQPAAHAGTISGLTVQIGAAIAAASSVTFTLQKNGVSTALTCVVAASTATCSDLTHSVTVAQGDLLNFVVNVTGIPGALTFFTSLAIATI